MNCGTVECAKDAVALAMWPGQPCHFCTDCLARAQEVASAMGFELPVLPLELSVAYWTGVLDAAKRLGGKIEGLPGKD